MSTPAISALEARIHEDPEDDNNWDVYADWLLEQGDPRAALFSLERRLQRAALHERPPIERELRIAQEAHYSSWLDGIALPHGSQLRWRGCFIVALEIPAHYDAILLAAKLSTRPAGRFLSSLTLQGIGSSDLSPLLSLQTLHLSSLTISGTSSHRLGSNGLTQLLESPLARTLSSLSLPHHCISDKGLLAFSHPHLLPKLTSLDLSSNLISDKGISTLALALPPRPLHTLALADNRIGDQGLHTLATSPLAQSLVHLHLTGNLIGTKGAYALARADAPRNLTSLSLRWNFIGPDGARALLHSESLRSLTSIDLRNNSIPTQLIPSLARNHLSVRW